MSLGVAESPIHQQQGQKAKLMGGITVPHTATHLGGKKKGKKSQASKRKRTPLLVYTSPNTGRFTGRVFRQASCWVLLGTHGPTGIWKQTTVFPRQKENMEPLRWKNVLEKQSNSPPLHPQTCTKGTDTSEESLCSDVPPGFALGTFLMSNQQATHEQAMQLKCKLL